MSRPLYIHRDRLKIACGIPATATGDHDMLDMSIETACDLIDDWVGYGFHPRVATQYLDGDAGYGRSGRLRFPTPILSISALRNDLDGNGVYESTWSSTGYLLTPYNAAQQQPPQPYWGLEVRQNSTMFLPSGVTRGIEIAGTWGYYDQRDTSTAQLSATGGGVIIDASTGVVPITGASSLHAGQTILMGDEQMFVLEASASGASSAGMVTVQRGVNGTVAAAHLGNATAFIQTYRYPLVERACLYQAQNDFRRGLADPYSGGAGFGEGGRSMNNPEADLHPAVRRMLRSFRTPVVA